MPSSVHGLLASRRASGRWPPHDDGASLALVVEGGAMRGVISAGMVSALEDLGCLGVFDAVYGSSAGAINAAYFVAGQANLGTTIYYEDINNRAFIDLGRPWRGRPIVDLDFLMFDVASHRKPLAVERVIGAAVPLSVIATDVIDEHARVFDTFSDAADLLGALRAGATMPIVAGGPFTYRGRPYLDASLTEPIPVPTAERRGHTHVLALLTRSGAMRPQPSAFDRYYVAPRLKRISPSLSTRYLRRAEPYAALLSAVDRGTGPEGRAIVAAIRVAGQQVSRLERRRDVLAAGAQRGYDAVAAFLAAPTSGT